ncbi:BnaA02g26480D [Brassica napus]|uniref:BnaA02g26480D protein n=2 Tax=Brassica TaxID=3705 RepID=A0A078F8D2_BRANA|nr:BnaA02g26480D [Brassica napus]VDC91433.1 unnamed protein product [Brassica rapa]
MLMIHRKERSDSTLQAFLSAWELEAAMDFVRHESSILHHVHKNSVIHGFIPAAHANQYGASLRTGTIFKVDRFEVGQCTNIYKITDYPFVIRYIPTTTMLYAKYGVQGSALNNVTATTPAVVCFLIDPSTLTPPSPPLKHSPRGPHCQMKSVQLSQKEDIL